MRGKNLLLAVVLVSTQVSAQSIVETTINGWSSKTSDYVKNHFQASYHGEINAVRHDIDSENKNEQKIKDIKIMHNPTLIYKPNENWQVLATAEFKFSDQDSASAGASFPNGFYRGLTTLTRKNILTEESNGIKLDVGVGRRQYNTGREQQADGKFPLSSYGNNRIFTTISKTKGAHSGSLFVQLLNNDYKKATASTWKNALEVIPTLNLQLTDRLSYMFNDDININSPKFNNTARDVSITHDMNVAFLNFQWNDKVGTYYQFKYLHNEGFSKDFQSEDDSFAHYVGVSYAITAKNAVTAEAGSDLFHARDGRKLFAKNAVYPELALYLDFAI